MPKPQIIIDLENKLNALVEADDKPDLAVTAVADYLGMSDECLRKSIYNGTCPFAIGLDERHIPGAKRGFCKISKLAFYNFETGGKA